MAWTNPFSRWFGALSERAGEQKTTPAASVSEYDGPPGVRHPDAALQLDTVWACIDRRASTVASLPLFVYERDGKGQKVLARNSRLYALLHDSPNARMTPYDFWRAMVLHYDLRGNAYARIDRDTRTGEAIALWPMPTDQVSPTVLSDGAMVYPYSVDNDVIVYPAEDVLHLRGLGNGTTGLSKLDFMAMSLTEAQRAQAQASRTFAKSGKPTGVLMIDRVLNDKQRDELTKRFAEMAVGNSSRLYLLEAAMKYEQISMTPEAQQLLQTRQFSVPSLCRWFDVPPVLVHHTEGVTFNGAEQLIDSWHKLSVRPLLVSIEQALRMQVMTPAQRARMVAEFNHDALLRGSLKDRLAAYAQATQNGIKTRNECRQLENDPPLEGGDVLTAQSNLVPLPMLGRMPATAGAPAADPIAQ
jgi:HK97 family phage portal protein